MGPINDGDSFDTDRLSGSIQYNDDDDNDLPPAPAPRMNNSDAKKLRKKEVRKDRDDCMLIERILLGRK